MGIPRFRHVAPGFEVRVFVRKIPNPPWTARIEVRATRWNDGEKKASWSRHLQIRELDSYRVYEPVFTTDTLTLHAESSASTGHGEYDDEVLTIRIRDGSTVA